MFQRFKKYVKYQLDWDIAYIEDPAHPQSSTINRYSVSNNRLAQVKSLISAEIRVYLDTRSTRGNNNLYQCKKIQAQKLMAMIVDAPSIEYLFALLAHAEKLHDKLVDDFQNNPNESQDRGEFYVLGRYGACLTRAGQRLLAWCDKYHFRVATLLATNCKHQIQASWLYEDTFKHKVDVSKNNYSKRVDEINVLRRKLSEPDLIIPEKFQCELSSDIMETPFQFPGNPVRWFDVQTIMNLYVTASENSGVIIHPLTRKVVPLSELGVVNDGRFTLRELNLEERTLKNDISEFLQSAEQAVGERYKNRPLTQEELKQQQDMLKQEKIDQKEKMIKQRLQFYTPTMTGAVSEPPQNAARSYGDQFVHSVKARKN